MDCGVCERIELTRRGENPYLVRELQTGYAVIGDHQRFYGYTLFLCKRHASELHELEPAYRMQFLKEMSQVAEAVCRAFHPDKLNYELLGNGIGHMHWHLFPRRAGDMPKPGPVWWTDWAEMQDEANRPSPDKLAEMVAELGAALDAVLAEDAR